MRSRIECGSGIRARSAELPAGDVEAVWWIQADRVLECGELERITPRRTAVGGHTYEHRGAFAALHRIVERQIGIPGRVVDHDTRILIAADRPAGDFYREREAVAAVARHPDEDGRVPAESRKVRPRHKDRAVIRDRDGLVVGELPVRSSRLAFALERADECQWMIGAAGGPGAATVARAAEPERDVLSLVAEAGEIGGAAVGAERDGRIAAKIVRAGARHGGIIRERGDAGDEAVRQRRRPSLAAVEGGVDAAAVVVVPVVVAGDHVARVRRIEGQGGLVLGRRIAADVDDDRAPSAKRAETRRRGAGDSWCVLAGGEQQARADGGGQ